MVVKKIELEVVFDDNFVPPDKFEESTWRTTSRCEGCPFCEADFDSSEIWCGITSVRPPEEECPIKKFFN